MDLRLFFATVGESVSLESLESLKQHIPGPYKLTLWYDACDRGVDMSLYYRYRSYTDDVILLTKNHGINEAIQFAMLCLDYDYLLVCWADCKLKKDSWAKLWTPYQERENVSATGWSRRKMDIEKTWNNIDIQPDGVQLINKKAVNAVGGIHGSFRGYGHSLTEWHYRCRMKGWNYCAVDGVMDELGTWHDGMRLNPWVEEEIKRNGGVLTRAQKLGFDGYDWWRSDL